MKRFVLKSALYLAIVFVLINGFAFLGAYALQKGRFYKPSFLVNSFSKGEKFKVAVFGTSRSLASLDTKLISNEMGGVSANFSIDYTALPTTKLMLEHFFAQGYQAEFILVSIDIPDFETSKMVLSENDYRFFPFRAKSHVRDYYEKYDEGLVKPLASSSVFPVLGYSYYNMELFGPSVISLLQPSYRYQFDELGNYQYPDYLGMVSKPASRHFKTALDNPKLEEIAQLVSEHSAKLIVYIAPYLADNVEILDSCPYFVLNHSRIIDDPKYFSDNIHVVNSGKKLATAALIEDIVRLQKIGTIQ